MNVRGYEVLTDYAVVFQIWADDPAFHLLRADGDDWKTVCGREVGPYKPLLPKKHVEKFARLCKGCQ